MINDLELKGNPLLIYALIHSFSRDGQSEFRGSLTYICGCINASRPTVRKALDELIESDLVIKRSESVNGITYNYYRSQRGGKESLPVGKDLASGGKESLHEGVKNLSIGGKEPLPYIIDNNNKRDYNDNVPTLFEKKSIEISFDQFWDQYDKKVGRPEAEKLWKKINGQEREKIMQHLPKYKFAQPEKRYRKNPSTYLNQKSWNDEIILDQKIIISTSEKNQSLKSLLHGSHDSK